MDRISLGRAGEDAAVARVRSQGLSVLERNWRCRWAEVDIVACDGAELVLIEVKTRRGTRFGTAREAVTSGKWERLALAASEYRAASGHGSVRIDVITVDVDPDGRVHLDHLRGVSG